MWKLTFFNDTNELFLQNRSRFTHTSKAAVCGYQSRGGEGSGKRGWDLHIHVKNRKPAGTYCVAEELCLIFQNRIGTDICLAEPLCRTPETSTPLCINSMQIKYERPSCPAGTRSLCQGEPPEPSQAPVSSHGAGATGGLMPFPALLLGPQPSSSLIVTDGMQGKDRCH